MARLLLGWRRGARYLPTYSRAVWRVASLRTPADDGWTFHSAHVRPFSVHAIVAMAGCR
eukprot:CAMPEP_0206052574 /NCGR_PEP_ID=MMETSP1466-20131121/34036_1 /ASSEMBLY_ACC=CAM_ASM_001126 /TAXON_ID=44452 /ORGANISM="Pavlova gyrans, Strain CCMP608" /LENGTH=58 /DNA_ID=CAMNT_0053427731 /DNA_START=43 /DNA_END=215 /DNA_ORIENTATION=-